MNNNPINIHNQFIEGASYKSAIGNKGLYEQTRINERFYIGDQWHGAKCGSDRPLVRHNIIKRIGDYKMSQILSGQFSVRFSADGIDSMHSQGYESENSPSDDMMSVLDDYFRVTSERVNLTSLIDKTLKNSYISGTGVIYTYWDSSVPTGFFADGKNTVPIRGDICCEVLNIEDIVFGDPYSESIQNQPYIILSCKRNTDEVIKDARIHGASLSDLSRISEEASGGKIQVYTKLYKKYKRDGSVSVFAVKTTEKSIIQNEFDTGLSLYPLSVFRWESKNNCAYGESEITYLIPNQIAINRMITANVWSAMTTGMPIMLVNGDTVTDKITNDPGQIIKVFGNNEDVEGAVKYLSPPSFMKDFSESIDSLINNTLTQSGANEVALGDSKADNATALATMRDSALMPLQTVKKRFHCFIEELARIWADFWICYYGSRKIKTPNNGMCEFISERYKSLIINTKVDISTDTVYSDKECLDNLLVLFEKGIIDRKQLLTRIPKGIVPDIDILIKEAER